MSEEVNSVPPSGASLPAGMHPRAPTFSGEDVVIRAMGPDDYLDLQAVYAQPLAFSWTLQLPLPSIDMWRERLQSKSPQRYTLVAVCQERVIGNIGLILESNPRRRHAAAIGMGVHDEFAGRGVGELLLAAVLDLADNWLNVSRVELTVFADNERAIRLYERLGFVHEGRLVQYAMRHGNLMDAVTMARVI